MDLRDTRTIILNQGDPEQKREEIRQYFHQTYSIDEMLYETLGCEEAFYLRHEPLRHPLIFYLGHTAAFYVNKLIVAKIKGERINPRFESMFAVGVDEMSWDDLNDANYDWPTVSEVKAYRNAVRGMVDQVIKTLPLAIPINWYSPFWAIMMGIEHQRIHLETSSVIIRRAPIKLVKQLPIWDICDLTGAAPENELLPVSGGTVTLGKSREHPLYGWDNEYGKEEIEVWDFSASRYLVSNKQFLEFINDHGYQTEDYWTEEGKSWLAFAKPEHPLFWIKTTSGYRFRTMAQEIEMPWSWPVELNYLEAKAFCNWLAKKQGKEIRLPTEAEWYRLRDSAEIPDQPYWERAPGNINLEHWASSCPVNYFRFGDFYDLIGNVWQWTETAINGFNGFEIHPYYDDFSTPTFDTKHNLIKGGSWISTGNEATRDSRYAFRRHFFQHAGLRYVESKQPLIVPVAMYENDTAVTQYCEAHYGKEYFDVPNFSKSCVDFCLSHLTDSPKLRALDLGCAVGRASFELARSFSHVDGVDFSARFIKVGLQLKETGSLNYELIEEGEIVSYSQVSLGELKLEEVAGRVDFVQGDALNLKPQYREYDLVFAANLLDRLYDPRRFLEVIKERINLGGFLFIASPYTWLAEHTKQENWLGGYRKDGEPQRTFVQMSEALKESFNLVMQPADIQFVIRETARKFQHSVAQASLWQRIR